MRRIRRLFSGIPLLLILWSAHALSDEAFTCPLGRKAACLDYSDKVVDQGSVCFSWSTCGVGGFVCKDKYDDVVRKYNNLVDDYNNVVDKNKKLAETAKDLSDENQRLTDKYNALLSKYNRTKH